MARRHFTRFHVVAYSRDNLRGTYNSIIASGATKRQAMQEYQDHMARWPAHTQPNYSYVFLYDNDVRIEVLVCQTAYKNDCEVFYGISA